MSRRLNKGYSTADEQPPSDEILKVRKLIYSAMIIWYILHELINYMLQL